MVGFLARSGEGEQVSYFKVPLLSTLRGPLCTTQGLRVSGRIRVGSRLLRTWPAGALAAEGAPEGRGERFPSLVCSWGRAAVLRQLSSEGRQDEQSIVSSDKERIP